MSAADDITQRKQPENALQEKNFELEKALLNKDQFLARLAFELRTGLNDVMGFTDTLLEGPPGRSPRNRPSSYGSFAPVRSTFCRLSVCWTWLRSHPIKSR